jgi:uncharacterized phiE125 gp8 family phage protein
MMKLIEGPASEPITLAEAKSWIKVETDADDDLITSLIAEARQDIEEFTGLALIVQTWDMVLDELPSVLEIQKSPLRSVTGIYYTDIDGTERTEPPANYLVDTFRDRILLKEDKTWEGANFVRLYNGWRIRFTAGETEYPIWVKPLVKRIIAYRYDNRGSFLSPELEEEIRRHKVRWL